MSSNKCILFCRTRPALCMPLLKVRVVSGPTSGKHWFAFQIGSAGRKVGGTE